MIDTEKLLGRINDKGVILSEKSISNLGVVRRRLVDIDGMLKDKLVLAKVREGIRRQEEERLKRVEREDEIEEKDDDDRDIDTDGSKVKRKKPKPSGPGGILGPAGALLTGAGFAVIAKNLGFFRVATQVLKGVGSVALATFMGLATVVDAGYKIVSAVEAKTLQMFGEKGLKTLKTFQKVFTTFVNVAVVSALSAAGMRAFGFTRGKLFPKVKVKPKIKNTIEKTIKKTIKTKPRVNPKIRTQENIFQKVKRKRKPNLITGDELKEKILNIKSNLKVKPKPKPRIRVTKKFVDTGTVMNIEQQQAVKEGLGKKVKLDTGKTQIRSFLKPEARIPDSTLNAINSKVNLYKNTTLNSKKFRLRNEITDILMKQGVPVERVNSFFEIVDRPKVIQRSIFDDFKFERQKSGGGGFSQNTKFNRIFEAPLDDFGIGGGNTISGPSFFNQRPAPLTSKQILSQQGSFNAPKIINQVTKNADNFTNIKSLSTLLEAFGGLPLVKATRQFLGNTVGRIPLLGDLIGIALDYFVFKEPIQRALFMAAGGALGGSIGAWLGGILGTAVPVVGNLAGAVVGGFLGGVGGDMLGGFLYDVLFAGKPGFPAGESQTPLEKGAKGVIKLGLSGGGLVPALLSMNNGGSVPDIAYSASYDKPGAGSVKFIPIFIPSEERDVEPANVSGVVITKRKRAQSSLYAGGLIA